jgi:hypothetical protein
VPSNTRWDALARLTVVVCAGLGLVACAAVTPPAAAPKLSAADLCARVPLAAVSQVLGAGWQQVEDPSGRCRYQSAKATATLTIAATTLTSDQWRAQVGRSGGKVTERDRLLVADYDGGGFGPLDELWWSDGSSPIVLRVENGVSLDEAVAIVAAARAASTPGSSPAAAGLAGTGSTLAVPEPASESPPTSSPASAPPAESVPPAGPPAPVESAPVPPTAAVPG